MADPVWGQLAKAQDDNQTIDQAVAAAIAAHEADADAHTGAGESLETHKSQEVIDHPEGSILADKESHSEIIIKSAFESLDNWTTVGTVTLEGWPGADLYVIWGGPDLSRLYSNLLYHTNWLYYDRNILIQATFWVSEANHTKTYFFLGGYVNDNNIYGFGFQIIGSVIKGFWGQGANPTFTADLGVDLTPHVFRAEYNDTNENVKFYIDGILKATIEKISGLADVDEPSLEYRIMTTDEESEFHLHVGNVVLARQM